MVDTGEMQQTSGRKADASFLATLPQLFVQQRKEWAEILVNWETANKYAVMDSRGKDLGYIGERGTGLMAILKRLFLRSHRPLDIDVLDRTGTAILKLTREFFFLFSDLFVTTGGGTRLGSIHRRFGILQKRYDLQDNFGHVFATVESPIWKIWTFPILDSSGAERATIRKKWGGALREMFTDADTYQIDFGVHPWTPEQRAVIFAVAISIDFDFFEGNQGSGGIVRILGD